MAAALTAGAKLPAVGMAALQHWQREHSAFFSLIDEAPENVSVKRAL
jgi:hypothetical protein